MNVKKGFLTPNEEIVMDFFWNHDDPLTSREIVSQNTKGWGVEQVSNMFRSLEKKGMIRCCGKVNGKVSTGGKAQPVRQFIPLVSREEYLTNFIISKGISTGLLHKMSVALVEEIGNQEVIEELEKIIQELEKENA